jgi:hypothetical protein
MSEEKTVRPLEDTQQDQIGARPRSPSTKKRTICKPEDLSQEEVEALHDICVAFLEAGGVGDADATSVDMVPLLLFRVFTGWSSDMPVYLLSKMRDLAQGDRSMLVGYVSQDVPKPNKYMFRYLAPGKPVLISVNPNREQERVD